jgi:hypothetical protein
MDNAKAIVAVTLLYVIGVQWWGAPSFREYRRCARQMRECTEREKGDTWNSMMPLSRLEIPGIYRELYGEDAVLRGYLTARAKQLKVYFATTSGLILGALCLFMTARQAK